MQKLFFSIYGAILASTLLLLALVWFVLNSFNQHRYEAHLKSAMQGTNYLLSRGIARQAPDDQQRWIELAASLMDANIILQTASATQQSRYQITPLKENSVAEQSIKEPNDDLKHNHTKNSQSDKYRIISQLKDSKQQVIVEFDGITEPVLSATAFFMLNELGRTAPEERQKLFDQLRAEFNYEVFRAQQANLDIDSRQLERLQRGETVVAVKRQFDQGLAFSVYAPWGKTSDALVLGPVVFFDPFPPYIAAIALASALVFMAILVMLLIRKLVKRLMALQHKVDAIGASPVTMPSLKQNREQTRDNSKAEVITGLSDKIQSMSQRIDKLLAEKAYMIRAVSHDLRTPIAKIHFRLEALQEQVEPDNKAITGIQNDLRQLNLLIDELLTYEKLSEEQAIEFQQINLHIIVSEQIEDTRLIYPNLSFLLEGPTERMVAGNEVLLRRLFENLLNNAGCYANKQVSVRMNSTDQYLEIEVNDDGPGLGDVDKSQLFEPFYKADKSRSAGKGGYGLGLAIVKQVAMQHSGSIDACNNPDGGACFKLTLPLKQDTSC